MAKSKQSKPSKPKSVAAKAPAAKKPAVAKRTAAKKSPISWVPGPEERYRMVQQAAYYIAERNNFNGNPMEFWSEAEAEIASLLNGKS